MGGTSVSGSGPGSGDPRRRIPRTDHLLALSAVVDARKRLSEEALRGLISRAQDAARAGEIQPEDVERVIELEVAQSSALSLRGVINATGIVVHTNLGRAPLSDSAVRALASAAGYVDVEMDLATGKRSSRGAGARAALLEACPAAEDALIVNNGAAALLLAVTAFAGVGSGNGAGIGSRAREVIVSRGELVEIGAGFRLPDLMETTGARLREVGTTNRTHLDDYARVIGPESGCLLKVHPSNFRVHGFTAEAELPVLRRLADAHDLPLVVDLGSGLLHRDDVLPDEPDASSALAAGAHLVIASGDKLFGGPQAGLILGSRDMIQHLAKHPLARAVRSDKLTLAAIEATLRGGATPVHEALHADRDRLRARAEALATAVGGRVVAHDGRVGGGGAPGQPLPGWAVELPEALAEPLRLGDPAVLARVHRGACLLDPRCVPERDDARLVAVVQAALGAREPRA
ncbi:L-seryl-tRNA(Sec) selenium transferase [Leucobacter sp. GX24907]